MLAYAPRGSVGACSSCHRRKIKCDRRPGSCSACSKIQVTCRYPQNERDATRRVSRGPYKKRKSPREEELEGLVKTMARRCNELEDVANAALDSSPHDTSLHRSINDAEQEAYRNEVPTTPSPEPIETSPLSAAIFKGSDTSRRPTISYSVAESPNLAVSNLTGSNSPDLARNAYSGPSPTVLGHSLPLCSQILELWQLYTIHINPVLKLIHCPSFSEQILLAASHPAAIDANLRALLFSIFYAVVDVVAPDVVENQFRQRREVLTSLYKQRVEQALEEATSRTKPSLYVLQALVIHIVSGTSLCMLDKVPALI